MTLLSPFPDARRVELPTGGWLNVHEQPGEGPTLILLHGFTDRAESFRLIAPHLAGRHLVMPDLRGHGGSFRKDINALCDFSADIEQMSDVMGLQEKVVVGHSMGALIAITLAGRARIDVRGLILLSGSLKPASPALSEITDRFAALPTPVPKDHSFLDEWYSCAQPVAKTFLDQLKTSLIGMRRKDLMRCLALLASADLRATAGSLTLPSLVISGGRDPIFPPDHRRIVQDYLRPLQEVFLGEVGHNPHWEAPTEVAAAILTFLSMSGAGQR
ncbi:MAG: alpha/beta fold hydrolase [Cypionkella sp.]